MDYLNGLKGYNDLLEKFNLSEKYLVDNNVTQTEFSHLQELQWQVIIILVYALIVVVGFLGNITIAIVIINNKQLHSVTNIFIANLAISDIGMCVFNLPFQLHYQLNGNWVFGGVMCTVFTASFAVPIYDSTMCILLIAIDRYILILHPFRKRMGNRIAVGLVLVIAILAIGPAIPMLIYTRVVKLDVPLLGIDKVLCIEKWPSDTIRKIFTVSLFLAQFCIPIMVTSVLYGRIYAALKNRPVKKTENRRSQRTNRILVSIVILFTICWLPWNIFSLIVEFYPDLVKGGFFNITDLFLKSFAMSSSCINPFLYGWLNDNFKRELCSMFGNPKRRRKRNKNHSLHDGNKTTTQGAEVANVLCSPAISQRDVVDDSLVHVA